MNKLRFFLIIVLLYINAFGQNYPIRHLDISSGLSNNSVASIYQDQNGYMWFGTFDGLNKYDGYKFTVYKNDVKDSTSITNNFITAIAEDANGTIWIATRGGGLNAYDKGTDKFIHFKNNPKKLCQIFV